ncbi:hypothetical protein [Paraliomyxa miuraensis]|uniref:hypothetical protein n=1 Tax=Paraliomyxa miuraensis TaxID=376150 RepID=UPI00224E16A3|nr:hypothetical protein [Paraliomyxa miuraensis]MCX4241630.1 hypothetical protein [Paraliomyxa miuraensis]
MGVGLTTGLVLGACAPQVDQGGCDENTPCSGRGQVCDLEVFECVAAEIDASTAESPAPGSFSNKVIAFHRGEICLPHEVQSGASMPVVVRQCLHPCVSASSYEFDYGFHCRGSRCDAQVLTWTVGASAPTGCPADAFSAFDPATCQYANEIEFHIDTETSSGPINGSMKLEIPFLTNADATIIAMDPDDTDTVDELVMQYPQMTSRIPDGRDVSILPGNPAPPESCRGGACPCYPIGF